MTRKRGRWHECPTLINFILNLSTVLRRVILIPLPLLDSTEHWNICMFSAQRERAKHPRCDICHRRICSNYSMSGAPSQPGVHSCTVRGAEPARGTQLSCEGCRPSQGYTAVIAGVLSQPGVYSCHVRGAHCTGIHSWDARGCRTDMGHPQRSYQGYYPVHWAGTKNPWSNWHKKLQQGCEWPKLWQWKYATNIPRVWSARRVSTLTCKLDYW